VTYRKPGSAAPPRRHRRRGRFRADVAIATTVVLVVLVAATISLIRYFSLHEMKSPLNPDPAPYPIKYLGVYEPGAPRSYANVNRFATAVGRRPNLVGYYSWWGDPFQRSFAKTAFDHGATTIVQMEPTISLARIAAGAYDSYLTSFARSVAAFKRHVVISFGREMNGFWYSWGYHRTKPSVFVAAWRHIVLLFRAHGADNVIWLWQVNSKSPQTGPVHDWWPGSKYVTWVGVSGYYFVPNENYGYIFTPVVADVRKFTNDPVLIAETGVNKFAGEASSISDLFDAVRTEHYLGLVWFDWNTGGHHPALYKGGLWRLEGNRPALRAFREGLRG
jgi:mannan endo-1,4-beta-mannosidase